MTSIGDRLRRQRLKNQISLEKVSLETKIGVRLLEAIEAGQWEKLPGGVFRKSFVLQYARALDIDPEEISGELDQLSQFDDVPVLLNPDMLAGQQPPSGSSFSFRGDLSGLRGSTIGSLVAAVGVIMACALIYSWWQSPREAQSASKVETASVQPPLQAAAPPPAAQPEPAPVVPQAAPTAPDMAHVRVGLSADETTWVSASSDGKNVFSKSLVPHETKIVEASERVRLTVGNAGGVEISLNGKPIGPIGPKGQVRVVELTPAGFQIVPRKSPTLEPL